MFGTPHGTHLIALAEAHGITASTVSRAADLERVLAGAGVRMAVVPSTRAANVARHQAVNAAIQAAVTGE